MKLPVRRYPSVNNPPYAFQKLCKVSMPNDGRGIDTVPSASAESILQLYRYKQGWSDYYNVPLKSKKRITIAPDLKMV